MFGCMLINFVWIQKKMNNLRKYIKKIFNKEHFEEGFTYIILENTENTNHPDKYSEGVFAWYENKTLKTSVDFQIDHGGDPIVLKKFLLKQKNIKEVVNND